MLRTALLGGNSITLDTDMSKYIETLSDQGVIEGLEVSSGSVAPGKAWVKATRANGETIMVLVQNTQAQSISLNGDVFVGIEIDQNAINNGALNNEDGTGIASIKVSPSKPSQNYLVLAVNQGGRLTDQRAMIPKIQSVAQRTSSLEQKMETQEQKVERLETGGQTNFAVERELGEDIEAGKCYFIGDGINKSDNPFLSDNINWSSNSDLNYRSSDTYYLKKIFEGENELPFGESIELYARSYRYQSKIRAGQFTELRDAGYRERGDDNKVVLSVERERTAESVYDLWGKKGRNFCIGWTNTIEGKYKYYPLGIYENIGKKRKTCAIPVSGYHKVSFTITAVGNPPAQLKKGFVFGEDSSLSQINTGRHEIQIPAGTEYLFLRSEVLDENRYYRISNIVLYGFEKGKKYLSTLSDEGRAKVDGIEKKGGRKGQRTYGIEQGIIDMQDKSDGEYFLGENGVIRTELSKITIGEIKGGTLSLGIQKNEGLTLINKSITGSASGIWNAPSSGLIFYTYSTTTDSRFRTYCYINDVNIIDNNLTMGGGSGFGIIKVNKGEVRIRTENTRYSSTDYNSSMTLKYFIPL